MSESTAVLEKKATAKSPAALRNGKPVLISMETFLKNYANREDGFKYEFEDGQIIKSKHRMNDFQQFIANNLTEFFYKLKFQGKIDGYLATEKDTVFSPMKMRVPDLCYMTPKDNFEAAHGTHPIPQFVIEVVSANDTANYYDDKIDLYLEKGVKVIWMIYPKSEKVVVYAEDGSSQTFRGEQICSASPVLPEYALPVFQIFQKPTAPK